MSGATPTVVVVGAINVDLVVVAPRLPGPGETVVGGGLQTYGGGKGANAAVAAARAGATVHLIGAVGGDDTGIAALAELREAGVDVGDVAVLDGESTGVALIVVDECGENQIAVGAGANAAVPVDHIRQCLRSLLPTAGCVLVSTEIPPAAVAAAVEEAFTARVRCILNPAPVLPVVAELLHRGPILTPNGSELSDLRVLVDLDAGTYNEVTGNAIFQNSGLAIDLALQGPTANTGNESTGPNHLIHKPVLTSADYAAGGNITVLGNLPTQVANTNRYVSVYASSTCGDAYTLLGTYIVQADANGIINLNLLVPVPSFGPAYITATDDDYVAGVNDTSEISNSKKLSASDDLYNDSFDCY